MSAPLPFKPKQGAGTAPASAVSSRASIIPPPTVPGSSAPTPIKRGSRGKPDRSRPRGAGGAASGLSGFHGDHRRRSGFIDALVELLDLMNAAPTVSGSRDHRPLAS